jgi:hypothetical protein
MSLLIMMVSFVAGVWYAVNPQAKSVGPFIRSLFTIKLAEKEEFCRYSGSIISPGGPGER